MDTTTENHKINAGLWSGGPINISNKTRFNLRPWEPIQNGPGVFSKPEVGEFVVIRIRQNEMLKCVK